jgi:hypothetical protein
VEWFLVTLGKVGRRGLLFVAETDLGFKDAGRWHPPGLIYHNDVFKPLRLGDVHGLRARHPPVKLDLTCSAPATGPWPNPISARATCQADDRRALGDKP